MNKKFFNLIVISICSIFFVTLVATGCFLYSDYKTGTQAAEKRFEQLFNQTENIAARYPAGSEDFNNEFNKAVGSPEYYYSLSLKTSSVEIYTYPSDLQSSAKPFVITKSSRLTQGNNIDLTLTASIYTLPSSIIFSRIKIAFIIILAATLSSALCLIYLYVSEGSPSKPKKVVEEYDSSDSLLDDDLDLPEEDSEEEYKIESEEKTDDEYKIDFEEEPEKQSSENKIETESKAYSKSDVPTETEENKTQSSTSSAPSPAPEANTISNLFNTSTGFCFESNLLTRLDSELARASSSQIELSLVLIQIPGLKLDSDCGVEVCKRILEIFHYRDMLFEYKTDGIAVIFSNSDIDKAMESSETIFAEICSILRKHSFSTKPLFGIASRSLRFISGERLMTEAEQALFHAKEDPANPIIAFRVNPEKYRKFMASKS